MGTLAVFCVSFAYSYPLSEVRVSLLFFGIKGAILSKHGVFQVSNKIIFVFLKHRASASAIHKQVSWDVFRATQGLFRFQRDRESLAVDLHLAVDSILLHLQLLFQQKRGLSCSCVTSVGPSGCSPMSLVKLCQALIYQRCSKMLHLTLKFLKTENKFISFHLQVSTCKPACAGGRSQSSPLAAIRVFKVLHQHFSSLYTLESEQEENIHTTQANGLGKKNLERAKWRSSKCVHLIHSGFSMHYGHCLGVVLKMFAPHRAKTHLWCLNQVTSGKLASQGSMYHSTGMHAVLQWQILD